ncbi:hypothetical protein Cch01nite_31850 [Cellulomonas chitinilytica]|uniref:Secreted protein n=1 Tax=Cellulomonas chitinilytica TaxID=398759 RepID=A0A919U2L4_9CELL|nr:hypothetical protein [Cellulomonas chitinilytica]GIG22461.1 hypothetical protein Cch01nite_31850 [Cellulomonas chitinilytica]
MIRRAIGAAVTVALVSGAAVAGLTVGHARGEREVWSYVGPGDVVCDTTVPDVPECWRLPDHGGDR